nr:hypothetical protein CFP56_01342 [Quercus suber]
MPPRANRKTHSQRIVTGVAWDDPRIIRRRGNVPRAARVETVTTVLLHREDLKISDGFGISAAEKQDRGRICNVCLLLSARVVMRFTRPQNVCHPVYTLSVKLFCALHAPSPPCDRPPAVPSTSRKLVPCVDAPPDRASSASVDAVHERHEGKHSKETHLTMTRWEARPDHRTHLSFLHTRLHGYERALLTISLCLVPRLYGPAAERRTLLVHFLSNVCPEFRARDSLLEYIPPVSRRSRSPASTRWSELEPTPCPCVETVSPDVAVIYYGLVDLVLGAGYMSRSVPTPKCTVGVA